MVVAGCVAKVSNKGNTAWKAYPTTDRKFIPMLFVAAVAIKQKLAESSNLEDGVPAGKILLRKPNPRYEFILNHLYDVMSKPQSYGALPADLRKAVRFFFALHGQKTKVRLESPQGGLRPQQIFFWTANDFLRQTDASSFPTEPAEIQVESDPPHSNPDIAVRIPILAEEVRLHLARPRPWYALYRRTARAPEDLPTHKIILRGSTVPSAGEDAMRPAADEQRLRLSELLPRHRRILLTGSSSSGKTTLLRMLTADLLGPHPPMESYLPILVSMKYVGFNGKGVTDLVVDAVVKQILAAEPRDPDIQQQIDIRRARHGDAASEESLFAPEVRESLTVNAKKSGSKIALFLDGYNESPDSSDPSTEQDILTLAERVDNVVVSTHASGAPHLLSGFREVRLEELSDEQIITYINAHLDGKGKQFFDHEIASNGRILSMARIPGHLELIIQYHKNHPSRRMPTCLGPLLGFFVHEQYAKKKRVEKLRCPDDTKLDVDFFLRKLAYALIDKGKERGRTVFFYPDELRDVFPSSPLKELSTLAGAAELLGFIDRSGYMSDDSGTGGAISFRHETIRDYFAARELRRQKVFDSPALIRSYIEHKKWDSAWLMSVGLIDHDDVFEKALANVSAYDPSFAADCLLAYPDAKPKHADQLLALFPLQQLRMLLPNPCYDSKGREYWPRCKPIPTRPAISKILSVYGASRLLQIYKAPETDVIIKDAIPAALVSAEGAGALPYLVQMARDEGLRTDDQLFYAFIATKSLEAFDILLELCVQGQMIPERWPREYCVIIEWNNIVPYFPLSRLVDVAVQCHRSIQCESEPSAAYHELLGAISYNLCQARIGIPEEWLALRNHPVEDIASAAYKALVKVGHPVVIEGVMTKYLSPDCDWTDQYEYDELQFLATKGPEGEHILLDLLCNAARHNIAFHDLFRAIPSLLARTTNGATMSRLVHFCLHENNPIAIATMLALSDVPEATVKTLDRELALTEMSRKGYERADILRRLCSRLGPEDGMVELLGGILDKWRDASYCPRPTPVAEVHLFEDLCQRLNYIESRKWQSIMRSCNGAAFPADIMSLIEREARCAEAIGQDWPPQNAQSLIAAIRKQEQVDAKCTIVALASVIIQDWREDQLRMLLASLLEDFRRDFSRGAGPMVRVLFHAIDDVRTSLRSTRMLDLLAGWPCLLPKKGIASDLDFCHL